MLKLVSAFAPTVPLYAHYWFMEDGETKIFIEDVVAIGIYNDDYDGEILLRCMTICYNGEIEEALTDSESYFLGISTKRQEKITDWKPEDWKPDLT